MLKNFLLATSLGFITGFELNIGLNVNIQFSEPVKFNYEKEFMNELYNLKKTKEVEYLLAVSYTHLTLPTTHCG